MGAFKDFISVNGLVDLKISSLKFTWSNLCRQHPILVKLERGLANSEFLNLFINTSITNYCCLNSDHNLIIFSSNPDYTSFQSPKLFKIELLWLSKATFFSIVIDSWSGSNDPFLSKLDILRGRLINRRDKEDPNFKRDKRILRGRLLGLRKALESKP